MRGKAPGHGVEPVCQLLLLFLVGWELAMGHTFVYMYLLSSSSGSVLLGSSPISRGVKNVCSDNFFHEIVE